MLTPIIGISTYRESASWLTWQQVPAVLVPADYADAVRAGGGVPVLVPPLGSLDEARAVVSRLDALVIAGGADLNPALYGQYPDLATFDWRDDRDSSEYALLDAADDFGLPVLGICRGMQLMAAHAGGRLHQHIPTLVGSDDHCPRPGAYGSVPVSTVPDTRLATIMGPHLTAHCHHHQAVAQHPGFIVSAYAADGTPEALEAPGERFLLGVQWHPETNIDMRLFEALVGAASMTTAR
jgi:putative glutamine amidotransferase